MYSDLAYAILVGVMVGVLVCLWYFVLTRARRRSDRARNGAVWLNVAYVFLLFGTAMLLVTQILWIVYVGNGFTAHFDEATEYLSVVGNYLVSSAEILVLVTFFELAVGFLRVLDHARYWSSDSGFAAPTARPAAPLQTWARYPVYLLALILTAINTTIFGMGLSFYVNYYRRFRVYYELRSLRKSIGMALAAVSLLPAVLYIALGIFLVLRCRGTTLQNSSNLYLAAASLWLLKSLWSVIFNAIWVLPRKYAHEYVDILVVVLDLYPISITVVLLFVICARRMLGLWTTTQPWMGVPPPADELLPTPPDYKHDKRNVFEVAADGGMNGTSGSSAPFFREAPNTSAVLRGPASDAGYHARTALPSYRQAWDD